MSENLDHILIFRTNITMFSDRLRVQELFTDSGAIIDWHIDSEDIDCVLRVVSYKLSNAEIIKLVSSLGLACSELE